ncbi:MAG: hypothetical protein PHU21_05305 [Elusimicrobia bacterium]|nr:hypothetical protein [Elusimicrobiota bacterium]
MTAKDSGAFALLCGLVLALLAPAVFSPAAALAGFGDLFAYHYPLRALVSGALQEGRLPFWNPYIFCGGPLSANSQAGLFYPLAVLCRILPLTLALSWDFTLHILWGGLGLLLLARREGLSACAALFLAGLYVFSPFVLYRVTAGIPTLLAALAWVPWCWLAFLSGRTALLAAVWALQFLSGHPQFLLANAAAMAAWALCRKERGRLLARLAGAGLGAAALAVVQWPDTWRFVSLSVRRVWPQSFLAAYSVAPRDLLTWLWPNALGNPLDGTWGDVPSVFFESCGVFIGWAGLLAAAAGLWGARAWRAAVLLALGVFLALGWNNPLYRLAAAGPAGLLRTPSRYLFLSLWGLVMAAGAGARRFEAVLKPELKGFILAAAFVQLLSWAGPFVKSERAAPYLSVNPALARAAGGRPLRVLSDPALASADKAMLYRAMNVNGYDAFYLGGFAAFAAASEGRPAADASRSYLTRADTPLLRLAGVAYRLAADGELRPNPGALPLAFFASAAGPAPQAPLEVRLPRPERLRAAGRAPGAAERIVVTIPAYPGWRAWLDGAPAALEPWGFFQAVRLPPGAAGRAVDLRLDFQPVHWTLCVWIGLLAWSAWLARCAASLREHAS